MTTRAYNGFSGVQREAAAAWSAPLRRAGLRKATATDCEACGSTAFVGFHSEDYSFPFDVHVGAYELCHLCHMALHLRARDPAGFDRYRERLREGATFPRPPVAALGFAMRAMSLSALFDPGPPRGPGALDRIAEGVIRTRDGERLVAGVLAAFYGQVDLPRHALPRRRATAGE